MLDLAQLFFSGSSRADAHLLVELSAVGRENDGAQGLSHFDGESGLA